MPIPLPMYYNWYLTHALSHSMKCSSGRWRASAKYKYPDTLGWASLWREIPRCKGRKGGFNGALRADSGPLPNLNILLLLPRWVSLTLAWQSALQRRGIGHTSTALYFYGASKKSLHKSRTTSGNRLFHISYGFNYYLQLLYLQFLSKTPQNF
jgi:hypothetical protein